METRLEDLRKWFGKGKKGDWVRVGTDGEIKGDCAREPGEGKPKCMPRSKAHSMSKKDRASSARRKRAADPQVDRPGTGNKPIMVKTDKEKKKKVKESVNEAIDFFKASKALTDYAKKHGGIDKRDFEQAGAFVKEIGKNSSLRVQDKAFMLLKKHIAKQDTDVRDKMMDILGKHGMVKNGTLMRESVDLEEKNVPTNPALWAKFKAQAKAKFDVYPSAYANGWAAKKYKAAGGGWKKSTKENTEMKSFFSIRESLDLVENYRTLATKGMGTEKKGEARVGLELDYYDHSGSKRMGKIIKVTPKGYIVKDDKDGRNRQFHFHDRVKAKEILAKHGKGKYNESVELGEATKVSRADFDKLKKGDMITIDYGSSIRGSTTRTFQVKSKTRSAKYNVDKVNMVDPKRPGGMKFHLYSRDGKDATLALGDMAATINSYKIGS